MDLAQQGVAADAAPAFFSQSLILVCPSPAFSTFGVGGGTAELYRWAVAMTLWQERSGSEETPAWPQAHGTDALYKHQGNTYLKKLLSEGKFVHVHVLPDNGLLFYGVFYVNLAAGLEVALIAQLKPAWNGAELPT